MGRKILTSSSRFALRESFEVGGGFDTGRQFGKELYIRGESGIG